MAPEWRRLPVHVLAVYKQRPWPVRRGGQEAWVPGADLACGCLRLRPGADYLLLGSAAAHTQPAWTAAASRCPGGRTGPCRCGGYNGRSVAAPAAACCLPPSPGPAPERSLAALGKV